MSDIQQSRSDQAIVKPTQDAESKNNVEIVGEGKDRDWNWSSTTTETNLEPTVLVEKILSVVNFSSVGYSKNHLLFIQSSKQL